MPLFVLHEHREHGPTHGDLMLQHGPALVTWRLPAEALRAGPIQHLPAQRLADHRSEYLTYEGPVSGGRGEVEAMDRGSYELISHDDDRWVVELSGQVLRGRFELTRQHEDSWELNQAAGHRS